MSLTSVLANLGSSGSGKPDNPSCLCSVMSAFCRDSYKPHASSQCLFVKKGSYQFIYLYFSLHKNFMLMVKSYLMRGYVFHNGKQYWKKQVMYEANCWGILPDVWPGDGSVWSYPR